MVIDNAFCVCLPLTARTDYWLTSCDKCFWPRLATRALLVLTDAARSFTPSLELCDRILRRPSHAATRSSRTETQKTARQLTQDDSKLTTPSAKQSCFRL